MNAQAEQSAANRRLGLILFGIFAGLTVFAVFYITMRGH